MNKKKQLLAQEASFPLPRQKKKVIAWSGSDKGKIALHTCLRSKGSHTSRKYRVLGREKEFPIRNARKMGREQKTSHPPPTTFLLSPHFPRFLFSPHFSRVPNAKTPAARYFVRLLRERLLRR